MSTLVFDIETVGEAWDSFDDVTKTSLTRWLRETAKSAEEYQLRLNELVDQLGFSPFTGKIVAFGLYDVERAAGVVYYTTDTEEKIVDVKDGTYIYKHRTESELLAEFWEGASLYDTFVTFNGRAFDVPFLYHRSAANHLRPTRNLLEGRYPNQQHSCRHVDLQDELTFFGAMPKRSSLHLVCRAYGIKSPKVDGVSGYDVASLYEAGEYLNIAKYNAADVDATTALYEHWNKYLNFTPLPADIAF